MQTRDNKVLEGRIILRQPVSGFRSGSDAVLLAAACHPPTGGHVVELGCGTGSAMMCVAVRRPDIRFTGLEIDAATADLAAFNIRRNGLGQRGRVLAGNVAGLPLADSSADLVLANPPFFVESRHRRSPDVNRDLARAETGARLSDWVTAAIHLLRPDGEAIFILRSERLDDLSAALPSTWSATTMALVGNPARPAKRILVRMARTALQRSAAPLYLHNPGGQETALAQAVMRHAAPIFWPQLLASPDPRDT